jgi:hypothetical protein
MTKRVEALLSMRTRQNSVDWVFPAPTCTGHIEKSSLKKQHHKAVALAGVEAFTLYTLRHTCLTRWAAHMDPYTPTWPDTATFQPQNVTCIRRRKPCWLQWNARAKLRVAIVLAIVRKRAPRRRIESWKGKAFD